MESVLDDCTFGTVFKQISAQRRAAPGCFGFTGARGSCSRSYHGFWENFNLPVVRGSETQTKRKERSISCIAIADIINDQVEAYGFNKRKSSPGASNLITARQTDPT